TGPKNIAFNGESVQRYNCTNETKMRWSGFIEFLLASQPVASLKGSLVLRRRVFFAESRNVPPGRARPAPVTLVDAHGRFRATAAAHGCERLPGRVCEP